MSDKITLSQFDAKALFGLTTEAATQSPHRLLLRTLADSLKEATAVSAKTNKACIFTVVVTPK